MSKQISKKNSDESVDTKSSDSESNSSDSSHRHKRSKRKRKVKKRKQSSSSSEHDSDTSESNASSIDKKKDKRKKTKTHPVKEVLEVERRNEIQYVSSDEGRENVRRLIVDNGDAPEKSVTSKWGRSSDDDHRKRQDWRNESEGRQKNNYHDRENKRGRFDHEKNLRNNEDVRKNRFNEREHDDGSYTSQKRNDNREPERRDIRRDFRHNNDENKGRYNDRNRNFNDYRRNDNRFKKPDDQWKNREGNNERFKQDDRSRSNEGTDRPPPRREHNRRARNEDGEPQRRPEREENWDRRNDNSDSQNRHNNRDEDRKNTKIKSEKERRLDWGLPEDPKPKIEIEKEKPNFGLSGKLTEETNKVNGVVIKYAEPAEARKPKRRWRLYPFKGEQSLPTLYIHRQSCYLIGRDRKICDLPVDHPSCSKQHAVLQYRLVPFEREDGSVGKRVRPYVIDLESANGTFINNKKVEGKKYIELLEKDVLKFGFSSREYVILHENSKDEDEDDDVVIE